MTETIFVENVFDVKMKTVVFLVWIISHPLTLEEQDYYIAASHQGAFKMFLLHCRVIRI